MSDVYCDWVFKSGKRKGEICGKKCLKYKEEQKCSNHNKNQGRCQYRDCDKYASFGLKRKTHCCAHKTPEMRNITNKTCEIPGCHIFPVFGITERVRCSKHKTGDMINLNATVCEIDQCNKIACFGTTKNTRCKEHADENMTNIMSKKCKAENCYNRPSYGHKTAIFCAKHAEKDMKNLVTKKCQFKNCSKIANYGTTQKEFCVMHKTNTMTDLSNVKCKYHNCYTRASFGYDKKTHCFTHKEKDMKNLVSKRCEVKNCDAIAAYGTNKIIRCSKHKTPEMIDLTNNKKCDHPECNTTSNFNYYYQPRKFCAKHKEIGMALTSKPKCIIQDCKEYAFYSDTQTIKNTNIKIPVHCEFHKITNNDIIRKECEICYDKFIPNYSGTDKRCKTCDNKWKNRQYKEYIIRDNVLKNNFEFIHDKTVKPVDENNNKVCQSTNYRPDFIVDVKNDLFKVILEIDENQHTSYKKLCESSVHKELSRIIAIHENDFGGFPLIFIRYNPDYYKSENQLPNKKREQVLLQLLNNLKNKTTMDSKIIIYYLFYDDYKKVEEKPLDYKLENKMLSITHNHPKFPNTINYNINYNS